MKGIRNGWIAACACWGACGFVSAQEFTLEGRVPGMRDDGRQTSFRSVPRFFFLQKRRAEIQPHNAAFLCQYADHPIVQIPHMRADCPRVGMARHKRLRGRTRHIPEACV